MKFLNDLGTLKYYLAFVVVVIGFYAYSAVQGWKWMGATQTDKERPANNTPAYQRRYFHK